MGLLLQPYGVLMPLGVQPRWPGEPPEPQALVQLHVDIAQVLLASSRR